MLTNWQDNFALLFTYIHTHTKPSLSTKPRVSSRQNESTALISQRRSHQVRNNICFRLQIAAKKSYFYETNANLSEKINIWKQYY